MDTLTYTNISQGQSNSTRSVSSMKAGAKSGQSTESKDIGDVEGSKQNIMGKGQKKKKGKLTGSGKAGASGDNFQSQENLPGKVKKSQRKNKDTLDASDAKFVAKKGSGKLEEDNLYVPSEDWIKQKILLLTPELGELEGLEHGYVSVQCMQNNC